MDTANEVLEVVDADDRVIGLERRGVIHERQLMHRSAHVLVVNGAGAVFVQRRALTKDACPGMWDSSAAGHVDPGESYIACARRELGEELGIDGPVDLQRLGKLTASRETGFEHCEVFLCRYDGPMRLDPQELAGGEWWSTAQMQQRVASEAANMTSSLRLIWRSFAGRLEAVGGQF